MIRFGMHLNWRTSAWTREGVDEVLDIGLPFVRSLAQATGLSAARA